MASLRWRNGCGGKGGGGGRRPGTATTIASPDVTYFAQDCFLLRDQTQPS